MKRTFLALLCLTIALLLAGCTAVNGDNSFQGAAPSVVDTQQPALDQPADAATQDMPATAPTSDPNAAGYNG